MAKRDRSNSPSVRIWRTTIEKLDELDALEHRARSYPLLIDELASARLVELGGTPTPLHLPRGRLAAPPPRANGRSPAGDGMARE